MASDPVYRSMDVRTASVEDIAYVARRMRPMDVKEIFSVRFSESIEDLIAEIASGMGQYAFLYALARRQVYRPVAIVGILLTAPKSGWAHMFATPEWPLIAADATRFIRGYLVPLCHQVGLTRVELRALSEWHENCRWLEHLGARRECDCQGLGPVSYTQFAWTAQGR